MAIILLVSLVLGVLGGWLVPVIFKSKRPYGLVGDILVCTIISSLRADHSPRTAEKSPDSARSGGL